MGWGWVGGTVGSLVVQLDTLDTKASRVGASTTPMGNEFQSRMVFREERGAILGPGGPQSELFVMGASLTPWEGDQFGFQGGAMC